MDDLYTQIQNRHVGCVIKNFQNKQDLLQLEESIIFNCTGLGSKILFQDEKMFGVRGQLIYLAPQKNMDYIFSGPMSKNGFDLYMIPLKNKIVLGGSYEYGQSTQGGYDPYVCEQIIDHAQQFLCN